jgi:2-oxoglutarate ferredoxin oxidoreductase subunit delta
MEDRKKKRKTTKIDIYRIWCKSCGICVAFCPSGALGKNDMGQPVVQNLEKCIGCGWCELRCPDFAISVNQAADGSSITKENHEENPSSSRE